MDEQELAEIEAQAADLDPWVIDPETVLRLVAEVRRLRAAQPIVAAALSISTYSRETVDAGLRRVLDACSEYEDALTDSG